MNTNNEIKTMVREKYAAIAGQSKEQNSSSCCGATGCCGTDEAYNIMADDYSKLEGYNPDADLGLGCGLPTEFANIKTGNTVGPQRCQAGAKPLPTGPLSCVRSTEKSG